MKTFGLEEAAEFLRISKDSMRKMADSGKVPGAKVGPESGRVGSSPTNRLRTICVKKYGGRLRLSAEIRRMGCALVCKRLFPQHRASRAVSQHGDGRGRLLY